MLWHKNLVDDLHGKKPYYGFACSPLVVGEVAVFEAGGDQASLVAVEKRTGQLAWRYGAGETGYSSPVSYQLDGKCWNAPVLCKGRVYCRNHPGDVVCLALRSP